jgi:formyltetrahydrofolate synthetase
MEEKVMDPSQRLIDLGKQNMSTLMRLTNLSLQGTARLLKIQTDAAKEVYAENAKTLKSALDAEQNGDVSSQWPAFSLYQKGLEKSWDLTRECIEAATQTQSEISRLLSEQMSALNEGFSKNIEQVNEAASRFTEQAQQATKIAENQANKLGAEVQRSAQRTQEASRKR